MSAATEIDTLIPDLDKSKRRSAPLAYLLGFIFALFIAILIFCYAVTRRANPVFLDSQGKPASAGSDHSHH